MWSPSSSESSTSPTRWATQTLHVGTRGYGLLLAVTAIGSVIGGLVSPAATRRLGMLPSLIIAGAVDSAVFAGLGLAPDPAVAALMLAGQGFTVTMWNVVTVSLRQQVVPAHLLGRVNSVYRMLGWGLLPVGALAGGFVVHAAALRAPTSWPACSAACPCSPPSRCWSPLARRPAQVRRTGWRRRRPG